MNRTRLWLASVILLASPAFASSSAGSAMLDLTTCQGAVLLTQSLSGDAAAAKRVKSMESLFKAIGDRQKFVPSKTETSFFTPTESVEVVNATVDSFSPDGFGIFKGPSLILNGTFEKVSKALSEEHSVDYGNCRANGLLKVCSSKHAPGLSRMIMSHPRQPADRVVLVCVEEFEQ